MKLTMLVIVIKRFSLGVWIIILIRSALSAFGNSNIVMCDPTCFFVFGPQKFSPEALITALERNHLYNARQATKRRDKNEDASRIGPGLW